MTDLTLGLALAGVLAVAGVLLYNRLQERSVRRRAERAFASAHSDVLMEDERIEPRLDPVPRAAEPPRGAAPDPQVDYIIELALPEAAAQARLAEAWKGVAQRFARRAFLLQSGAKTWQAALQLVSRAGVVPEPELIEFRSALEGLAAALGGSARAPGMREALQAARKLDSACAEADIQVALHVIGVAPQQDFPGQPFQAAARADGVTLLLDVARTAQPERSYEVMARAGQALAHAEGGRLVDDEGRELDERALAAIRGQLEAVRRLLAGHGIEPGSPLALRLFS